MCEGNGVYLTATLVAGISFFYKVYPVPVTKLGKFGRPKKVEKSRKQTLA